MVTIKNVTDNKKGMRDFINLPYLLYENDEHWVPSLKMERKIFFNKKRNPFFAHADVAYFLAYRGNKPVGRVTAHIDHNYNKHYNTDTDGFFGFFECEENQETTEALISEAEIWLKNKSCSKIIGPMNFTTNHDTPGFLVKGFESPPVIMMQYTKKYYPEYLKNLGYTKEKLLYAYSLKNVTQTPEFVKKWADKLMKKHRESISMRHLDLKNLKADLDIVLEIFNEAWSSNWGYVPMNEKEIKNMASELKLIADPVITFIVFKNDEPAGFMIAVPDVNEVLHKIGNGRLFPTGLFHLIFNRKKIIRNTRVILMGVKKKFRRLGLDFLMYNQIFCDGLKYTNYNSTEMSWTLEDNKAVNQMIERLGGDRYKEYLVMSKKMDSY